MEPSTKVLKVNAGFREVSHFGVTHHMNADNSVAYFKSWQDFDKGTAGGMIGQPMHQGIPMTQEELDTYYPALKENTMLTKSKIGSGKVRFKDLQQPLACMYQGKVYLVAPFDPDDAPVLPKSMTKPKHTAEQQKYLDAHKREEVAGYSHEVVEFDMPVEYIIREAKRLEKQGSKVHIQSVPSPHGRPGYTLTTLESDGSQRTPAAAPKPKKQPSARSKSGMVGKDTVVLGDHSVVQIGATVMTKQGAGQLRGIDTTTYSMPFCSVQLTDDGPHRYEHVYVAAAELTQKKAKKAVTPKAAPDLPPALAAPPELAADVLGAGPTPTPAAPKRKKQPPARKPAPDLPPILAAPPELTADVLGTGPMGLTPTPAAPKPKKQPKKTAAKPRKTTKKPAKPKAKKTAAAPKLTASQREYLAIQGFVMVKRGGKYVRITG